MRISDRIGQSNKAVIAGLSADLRAVSLHHCLFTPSNQTTMPTSQKSTPKSALKAKKRLNLELTPEAYELLQKLSNESGKNMADVLRTGLALYGIAQEEEQKGRNLAVVKDDKVLKQIVAI